MSSFQGLSQRATAEQSASWRSMRPGAKARYHFSAVVGVATLKKGVSRFTAVMAQSCDAQTGGNRPAS
jgi:hypothetical protein